MIDLLFSILSSTGILLIFKLVEKYQVKLFPPIVINYVVAALLGFSLSNSNPTQALSFSNPWIWFSIIIGVLLIVNFYIIGTSTQKAGIAVTTVAAKMSFGLPVIFSLLYDVNDAFTWTKAIQVMLAMVAVFLVVYKGKNKTSFKGNLLYPIMIFVGLGVLDTLIKYCQYHFITDATESSLFSAINFTVAGIIGLVVLMFNRKFLAEFLKPKVLVIGIALGVANFGSMYFLINALNSLKFDSSLVFGINNIAIIALSVIVALLIFKEHFSKINWIGFALAILVLFAMIRIFV